MKRMLTALVVTTMVIGAQASPLPDYPFVFVSGDAKTEVKPDICHVRFQITIRDQDPTNGLALVEKSSIVALAILADNGVKKEDVIGFEVDKEHIQKYESRDKRGGEMMASFDPMTS